MSGLHLAASFDAPSPVSAIGLDPHELAQMLRNPESALVLDCRSFLAYNQGHVVGAYNVTCPTLLLKRLHQKVKKRRGSQTGKKCHLLSQLVNAQEVCFFVVRESYLFAKVHGQRGWGWVAAIDLLLRHSYA